MNFQFQNRENSTEFVQVNKFPEVNSVQIQPKNSEKTTFLFEWADLIPVVSGLKTYCMQSTML